MANNLTEINRITMEQLGLKEEFNALTGETDIRNAKVIMESTASGAEEFWRKKYEMLASTKYRQLGITVSPIFSWETEPVAREKQTGRAIETEGKRAIEL